MRCIAKKKNTGEITSPWKYKWKHNASPRVKSTDWTKLVLDFVQGTSVEWQSTSRENDTTWVDLLLQLLDQKSEVTHFRDREVNRCDLTCPFI